MLVKPGGSSGGSTFFQGVNRYNPGMVHPMGGAVAFQLDDAWADQYDAMKIMAEYGHRATVYVSGNRIGGGTYVTAAQLVELEEDGHEIGTHAFNHEDLATLTEAQLIDNFRSTKEALLAAGVKRPWGHAYPFGSRNATVTSVCRRFHVYGRLGGSDIMRGSPTRPMDRWNAGLFEPGGILSDALLLTEAGLRTFRRMSLAAMQQGFVIHPYMHELGAKESGLRQMCAFWRMIGLPVVPYIAALRPFHNRAYEAVDHSFADLSEWNQGEAVAQYDVSVNSDLAHVYADSHSVRVEATGDGSRMRLITRAEIPVEPRQEMTISVRVKIPAAMTGSGVRTGVFIYSRDSDAPTATVASAYRNAATTGFETVSAQFVVPDNGVLVMPYVHVAATSGVVYLDQMELTS